MDDEVLCNIEIIRQGHIFIAKLDSQLGVREFHSDNFETLLRDIVGELQEEFSELK